MKRLIVASLLSFAILAGCSGKPEKETHTHRDGSKHDDHTKEANPSDSTGNAHGHGKSDLDSTGHGHSHDRP